MSSKWPISEINSALTTFFFCESWPLVVPWVWNNSTILWKPNLQSLERGGLILLNDWLKCHHLPAATGVLLQNSKAKGAFPTLAVHINLLLRSLVAAWINVMCLFTLSLPLLMMLSLSQADKLSFPKGGSIGRNPPGPFLSLLLIRM